MLLKPISPASYRRSPWKNGGGVTIDVAEERRAGSAPGSWEGLIWRLGRTTISTPAPFSDLPGIDRVQMVIAGRGLALDTPEGEVDLREPFRAARYRGEAPIVSRLEDGPVEVVNLMGDRALVELDLAALGPGMKTRLGRSVHVAYAPEGARVSIHGHPHAFEADHALMMDEATGREMACEAGLVLLASISFR